MFAASEKRLHLQLKLGDAFEWNKKAERQFCLTIRGDNGGWDNVRGVGNHRKSIVHRAH